MAEPAPIEPQIVIDELVKTVKELKIKQAKLEEELLKAKPEAVLIVMDSSPDLGNLVAKRLEGKVRKLDTKIMRFKNNEINTFPVQSVRQKEVYIMGTSSNINGSINDNIMAMASMIRACHHGSAKEITLLNFYYGYSRSDKKDQPHAPIMAGLIADFFKIAGADRLITVDLHAGQIQGFFDGPMDNLYAIDMLIEAIRKDFDTKNIILVSPDTGGEKRASAYGKKLGVECTFMTKSRDHNKISVITKQELVHKDIDLKDKIVIEIDDMCDSLGTMCNGARILKEKGAARVIAVATHGIFSGAAFENLAKDDLDIVYVTNSLPQEANMAKSNKIRVVDISKLISDAILACVNAGSLSALFS